MTEERDEGDRHVTRRELALELRSFRNEMRILIVGAIVVLRFDVPAEVTAAALLAFVVKLGWTALIR